MMTRGYDPRENHARCDVCPLFRTTTPVPPIGSADAELVIVGEAPGWQETHQGKPFIGASGVLLDEMLETAGFKRSRAFITNSLLCLKGESKIVFADRTTRSIREVVKKKLRGPVLSVDLSGRLVPREIIGWHSSPRGARGLFKVTSKYAKGNPGGSVGPILSEDHLVLTNRCWIPVKELRNQSLVLGRSDLIATGHVALSGSGEQVVLGSMLGDGGTPRPKIGRAHVLNISHVYTSEDYLRIKAKALSGLSPSFSYLKEPSGSPNPQWRMTTRATPWLGKIAEEWYGPGNKRMVPRSLRLTPMMIAIWFFDNGYMRFNKSKAVKGIRGRLPPQPCAEFATNRFDKEDVEFLCGLLALHGIFGHPRYGSGWRIQINTESAPQLSNLIAPYAPPSMQYKLMPEHRGQYRPEFYDPDPPVTFWDQPIVEPVSSYGAKTLFCIDVEETHNFVTTNAVVHNCRAEVPGKLRPAQFTVRLLRAAPLA